MEGPGLPVTKIPARRRVRAAYRIGVYVYEYEATSASERMFVPRDDVSTTVYVERSGLSGLTNLAEITGDEGPALSPP
jgi:hypothetical protein